jgi:divalent metal cation (Fe/Co/Zn/Cd) transporter
MGSIMIENPIVLVFTLAGLLLIIASLLLWSGRPRRYALNKDGQNQTQTWRAAILIVWTLALPAYSLWEWLKLGSQPPSNFAAFQYGHKVLSDVWTAVAVVLGLLFGIKKF